MTVSAGDCLGPYEIVSPLGAGGMGEVFRARDMRLGRDVAVKVLSPGSASHPDRIRRFKEEARSASALNHPSIVTVYDIGSSDSTSYMAMELVEGVTLRKALTAGALPLKKLLAVAAQAADGLAAAHAVGIVHRDLKPENLMITRDGYAKILDFGLAKLTQVVEDRAQETRLPTLTWGSEPGVLRGTVGYMSPEQASCRALDFRSDQFSFGAILYEMATGKRAFSQPTAAETLASIIRAEPEPIAALAPSIPAPLRWVIERCLAKDREDRYGSTKDLARDLAGIRDHLSEGSVSGAMPAARRRKGWPIVAILILAAAVLAGFLGLFVGKRSGERPLPDFQRLTYRRGDVKSARFAPDGRTIVYGASWDGEPERLFSTRTDGRQATGLELPEVGLLAVSSAAELALSLNGTLARAPLAGGAPREIVEGVTAADWSPDGKNLAIVRRVDGKNRLEFPIGKILYETEEGIESPRVSPGGDRIAFLVKHEDVNARVEMVDLAGKRSVLSGPWKRSARLAWSADGSEVWFDANERGWHSHLYAVTLTGKLRLVMRLPSYIGLQDISPDGRVLVSLLGARSTIRGMAPGDSQERDFSWHEGSFAKGLTPDGKTLLFDEGGEGHYHAIYVRPTDGSPAKLLGDGRSMAISPDGKWVATNSKERGSPVVLLPTGAGEPKAMGDEGNSFDEATFLPDSKRLLTTRGNGTFLIDIETGRVRAVAEEGFDCPVVSPDGSETACTRTGAEGKGVIFALEGARSRPIPGLRERERLIQWGSDGRSLYVGRQDDASPTLEVFRLDSVTGKRELWREFRQLDPATGFPNPWYYFAMTPDAKSYAYTSFNIWSDLYLVTGLR